MKAKTTTITLTAHEIEIIKMGLNHYSLQMMEYSKTWAKGNELGYEDIFHREVYDTERLWLRFFDAGEELKKEEETIEA